MLSCMDLRRTWHYDKISPYDALFKLLHWSFVEKTSVKQDPLHEALGQVDIFCQIFGSG